MRVAIDRKAGAGDRARAERVLVRARVGRPQPHGVALELFDDRQQVVRDGGRLRRLGMGVGGEDGVAVLRGQAQQRSRSPWPASDERQDHLPLLHPVHRHVDVVARARGVQPAGGLFAAAFDDQTLDEEEEILAGAVVASPA